MKTWEIILIAAVAAMFSVLSYYVGYDEGYDNGYDECYNSPQYELRQKQAKLLNAAYDRLLEESDIESDK